LLSHGVRITRSFDHAVTKSLYFSDLDGNPLEVYVESDPSVWRDDPGLVASGAPLRL